MKKALFSLLVIAMAVAAVGAGTFAQYTDSVTSTGNTFTAGELDLYLNGGTQAGDSVTATWVWDCMVPGECSSWLDFYGDSADDGERWAKITLKNKDCVAGDHVEILVQNNCVDPAYLAGDNEESDTLDGAAGMDEYIRIQAMTYNGVNFLTDPGTHKVLDLNSNGFVDLDDVENQGGVGGPLDDLDIPFPDNGPGNEFALAVCYDATAPNDYQGDTVEMTITFTLNQDSSQ